MVSIVEVVGFNLHVGIDAHLNESQKVDANISVYDKMIAGLQVETSEDHASDLVMA